MTASRGDRLGFDSTPAATPSAVRVAMSMNRCAFSESGAAIGDVEPAWDRLLLASADDREAR